MDNIFPASVIIFHLLHLEDQIIRRGIGMKSFVKLSEETIVNMNQIQYCKIYRTPVEGQLVPHALLQVFFNGTGTKDPVQFEGEEAERLWQTLEYHAIDRPEDPKEEY
jgi:hypothetical protein